MIIGVNFQRETNKRHNGILRMFIPKGKDISKHSESNIQECTDKINAKPRKILEYNTPEELFDKELDRIYKSKVIPYIKLYMLSMMM